MVVLYSALLLYVRIFKLPIYIPKAERSFDMHYQIRENLVG